MAHSSKSPSGLFLDVVTSSFFHQTRGVLAASDLEVYLYTSNYIGVFHMSLRFSDMSVRSEYGSLRAEVFLSNSEVLSSLRLDNQ